MNLAVLSDSHDDWINLEWGVNQANDNNCELLIFLGDLIAPPGLEILRKFSGEIYYIWGNNEGEKMKITSLAIKLNIEHCDYWFEKEISGKKIVAHHWPRPIEIALESNLFDLVLCGHSHEWRLETKDKTILLNPGSIKGSNNNPGTMAIVNLENMHVTKLEKVNN